MPCTDWHWRGSLAGLSLLAGCSAPAPPPPPLAAPASSSGERSGTPTAPAPSAINSPAPLPPPGPVRNWDELRLQAARRLMLANPLGTYSGTVPDQLLAIPVLQIELHGDGSIRKIEALRLPRQAKDTTQLAIAALHRAAPFGDVSRLPKPWRFVETFLFNEERKFKPRSLD